MKNIFFGTITAIAVFIISGCEYSNPMTIYDGVDFLGTHDLTEWSMTNPGTMNYAAVNAVTAGDFNGLPGSGADAHRLEVLNLLPNGDFEGGGTAGWSSSANASFSIASSGGISGNSLMYSTDSPQETVEYDFSAIAAAGGVYRFIFSLKKQVSNDTPWYVQLLSGTTVNPLSKVYDAGGIALDETIAVTTNNGSGSFMLGESSGTAQPQAGYIDDIRMGRTDLDQYITFNVPYQETAGLPLVSGAYRFSVWIKAEISTQLTPDVPNRYPATGVILEIDDEIADTAAGKDEEIISVIPGTWTLVSMTKTDVVISDNPVPANTDPMIQLRISPLITHSGDGSIPLGSVLIAEPALTLSY